MSHGSSFSIRRPLLLSRVRHFRGHGIHSPFAYSFKREILMSRSLKGYDCRLYVKLRMAGVRKGASTVIQNMYDHYNYSGYLLNELPSRNVDNNKTLLVLTDFFPVDKALSLRADSMGVNTVCIINPRSSRNKRKTTKELVSRHDGMSIETRGMLLLIFDKGLNKQYIKL